MNPKPNIKWTVMRRAAPLALATLVCACGGGGSSDSQIGSPSPPDPSPGFPLAAAYRAMLQHGSSHDFYVYGDCVGTATFTALPAAPAASPVGGYEVSGTLSAQLTGGARPQTCNPQSIAASYQQTYDSQFNFVASDSQAFYPLGNFGSFPNFDEILQSKVGAVPLPEIVFPGDQGTYGGMSASGIGYTGSTKLYYLGSYGQHYLVTYDTPTTVLVDLEMSKNTLSNDGQSLYPALARTEIYRLSIDGTFTLISIRLYPGAGAFGKEPSLVYTPR